MKRYLSSIAAATLALSTVVPAFAAQTTPIHYQSATITLNTKVMSHPDRFTYNNTTYMPIWYVQQVLTQMGVKNAWNGVSHTWNLSAKVAGSLINAKSGLTSVLVNGHEMEAHVPTLVKGDPLHHNEATTFMPIWYVQQVLNRAGTQADVWNGTFGVWALGSLSTLLSGGSNTSGASGVNVNTDFPNAATIARYGGGVNPAPQGVTLAQWEAAVKKALAFKPTISSGVGTDPLATATQWYPDPHDIFYNKVFPVKDLKNGFILQKDPLVEVQWVPGASNARGGYVYVDEYVGFGNNPAGAGLVTYWKTENVSVSTGQVQSVTPNLMGLAVFEDKLATSPQGQGYQFLIRNKGTNASTAQPVNPTWGDNAGNYVIPFPGWNPFHLSAYSAAFAKQ